MHFALVGPVLGAGDELVADGIIAHVCPLGAVAVTRAQLCVPCVDLPDGALLGCWPG